MRHYLITGATGFIGSYLIKKLLNDKNVFIYGISRSLSPVNNYRYWHIKADLTGSNWFSQIKHPIDTIINLAQSDQYRNFPEGAEDMLNVNTYATFFLLEYARKKNIKRFIQVSTANVYGQNKSLLTEKSICFPATMYAATKYASELIASQYKNYFEIIIMRLFTVYGPNQKNMLIPTIIQNIIDGKPITLAKGKGLLITPIYITDCIEIINKLILSKIDKKLEIFNISSSQKLSLAEITSIIGKYLNKKIKYIITKENPQYLIGSNKKIITMLKYLPQVNFDKGIKLTLDNHLRS